MNQYFFGENLRIRSGCLGGEAAQGTIARRAGPDTM
jgi:hypothetical protein